MSESMYLNSKPVIVGATAAILDKLIMGESDLMKSVYFGVAVGAGVYSGEMIAPYMYQFPSLNSQLYNGKTLGTRITEVGIGSVLAFGFNRYTLNNDNTFGQANSRLATIIASDIIGTYITDYLAGKELDYLGGGEN